MSYVRYFLCFTCANFINPHNILMEVNHYYSYFTEEECEAQKIKFLVQDHTVEKGQS